MKAKEIKVLLEGYVPWQLCPKCDGEKVVSSPSVWFGGDGLAVPYYTQKEALCGVCGGRGVIPMVPISLAGDDTVFGGLVNYYSDSMCDGYGQKD